MSSTSEDSANESNGENGEELELPETDLEESVIIPRKTGRRMRVMSSSEEDDDPVILSPKTRRSIGIRQSMRLAASDESDSDLLESEDELDSEHSSREPSHIENSNGPEEDTPTGPPRENTMDSRNASTRMRLKSSSEEDDAASENSESDLEEELDSVSSATKEMTDKIDSVTSPEVSATEPSHPENSDAPEEDTPTGPPRDSTFKEPTPSSFEKSVFGKIQSTPCATGNTASKSRNHQKNDMKEISKRLVNLDITTDEIILLSDDSTNDDSNKQLVSPAVLNAEKQKLEKLFQDQQRTMELYKKMGQNLPDKGAQLLKKNKSIEEEVERQMERISQLSIKEDAEESSKMEKNAVQEQGAVCVERLDDGNEFKEREAKLTTQRGLKMLEAKKKITVGTIEGILQSLKETPSEDMLMDDPRGLKVPLMDHQKYALTFMTWREKNRPRGGILADDMGTGKTLTMISLMLQDKMMKEKDGSDDGESPSTWKKRDSNNLYNGGTLVVCPASLMQQWCGEVKTKCVPKALQGYQQHGSYRESKARRLAKYDLVITTYDTLSSEFKNGGAIFGVKWHRVILDEGHIVRNHKTMMAKACFELVARNRWVLTGTPIQNSVKDMFSVIKFLECEPFCDIHYWNIFIGDKTCKAEGYKRLNTILKLILLRRTKAELQAKNILPSLPSKEIKTVAVSLTQDENILYQKFLICSKALFAEFLSQRNIRIENDAVSKKMWRIFDNIQSNMHSGPVSTTLIFVLILRLRQICCHPGLMHINSKENDQDLNASSGGEGSAVGINLVDVIERMDVDGATEDARNLRKINKAVYTLSNPSSKIAAVISEAINIIESTDDKIVIVSQWASLLNIIGMHLSQRGLGYLLLTGATKISDRGPIIENFNDPDHPTRVFLLSLATGGVGLNLIGGNHLFVVDPHWNPQLEFQAHDRIYRMGQKKDVQVLKFVTSATVEERVVSIQQKKVEVSDAVLTGVSKIKKSGLSMADLRKLFDM